MKRNESFGEQKKKQGKQLHPTNNKFIVRLNYATCCRHHQLRYVGLGRTWVHSKFTKCCKHVPCRSMIFSYAHKYVLIHTHINMCSKKYLYKIMALLSTFWHQYLQRINLAFHGKSVPTTQSKMPRINSLFLDYW